LRIVADLKQKNQQVFRGAKEKRLPDRSGSRHMMGWQ
jgi:hypothetical protein